MADKVIITNLTTLKQKYSADGLKAIKKAVTALIAADKDRGFKTVLLGVDDKAAMKKLKATAVKNSLDPKENKVAIDGIYAALTPDYIMILGAIDVIPHQDLKNPLFSTEADADDDKFAYGDLPYACEAPYSQSINDFTGPTRVVGRLPDLTGHKGSPKYLLGLLETATTWKSLTREDYENYLGISVQKWKKSTALSLRHTFNNAVDLQTSPTKHSNWKTALFNRRSHFINCHGGDTMPDFFGQSEVDDDIMPTSHRASLVEKAGNILEGTVVAAECCYGGQLYDPTAADANQMGMCNAYLARKAYAFFGSTTTAYGPFASNNQADLICQYFLQRVLAGSSIGRATLEARQRFVEAKSPLSNTNQKTLAQFNLYGDPSIVPVSLPTSKVAVGSKAIPLTSSGFESVSVGLAKSKAVREVAAVERSERRQKLRAKGLMLGELQPSFKRRVKGPSKSVQSSLYRLMRESNYKPGECISFDVTDKPSGFESLSAKSKGISKKMAAKQPQVTAFHVGFGVKSRAENSAKKTNKKGLAKKEQLDQPGKVKNFMVLEAKEVNGKIVSITESHSK
ncbi:MAG TPA: C25 family cysteine peptidase [Pyrinomonadaceae bacterium]|nr:C25 family cysteine peptidase [Pyrinomonadaceae bacterium]